jgi:hypothetical protein
LPRRIAGTFSSPGPRVPIGTAQRASTVATISATAVANHAPAGPMRADRDQTEAIAQTVVAVAPSRMRRGGG